MRRFILAALLLASPAYADDDPDALDTRTQQMADSLRPEARTHFVTGYRAFNAKDYKTSSSEFETAYKIDPEVPLLFTWAQSERLGGNCPHAVDLYQKYLYSDINKGQADFARHWIDVCGGVVATQTAPPPIAVDTGPPRYVWYTDKPPDALALGGTIVLAIGIGFFIDEYTTYHATASHLDDHEQLREDAIHQRSLGIGATIAGSLLAGAGIGLYFFHAHQHEAAITADAKGVAFDIHF
jgi:hypothetical protein